MKKKTAIAVIARRENYIRFMTEKLSLFLGDAADFHGYIIPDLPDTTILPEDCVVLSSYSIFQQVRPKLKKSARVIMLKRSLYRESLNDIRALQDGTSALLVNIDYKYCMEMITSLYREGNINLQLEPYYPGCEYDPNIRVAITPGETQLVPPGIQTVIDIGERAINMDSVYELAEAIGVADPVTSDAAKAEVEKVLTMDSAIIHRLNERKRLLSQISAVIDALKIGVVITDVTGQIQAINRTACDILEDSAERLEKFNITEIIPELRLRIAKRLEEQTQDELVTIHGRKVMTMVSDVMEKNGIESRVITLEYFNQGEERQYRFRKKAVGMGHRAAYTFDQIKGESEAMRRTIEIAKRIARSDGSVCITGESGTGKELFAQSIHNASRRSAYSFVAINCSAVPENLLESEMYGYEEGAFTGAAKGGKSGLFELAHRGTLFLDEVGELPMQMQAKLLRAIEEKKILKIGGKDMIDVDVRIISATNRDLLAMVHDGRFREDLYYRLCVLPIQIPPLRSRGKDILLLFEELQREMHATFTLSREAENMFLRYGWHGNVRELKNVVEYLDSLEVPVVAPEDLPMSFHAEPLNLPGIGGVVIGQEEREMDALSYFMLEELMRCRRDNRHGGRGQLLSAAHAAGFFATESEVRNSLHALSEQGYIYSRRGRGGSDITELGMELLRCKNL